MCAVLKTLLVFVDFFFSSIECRNIVRRRDGEIVLWNVFSTDIYSIEPGRLQTVSTYCSMTKNEKDSIRTYLFVISIDWFCLPFFPLRIVPYPTSQTENSKHNQIKAKEQKQATSNQATKQSISAILQVIAYQVVAFKI